MTEKVVKHFLTSGTVPEQGYKSLRQPDKAGGTLRQGAPGKRLWTDPCVQRSALRPQH